ncbi:IS91 family transposase [Shewanella sp. SP1S1-7]|uniref:IS91 family transposase n=1 Tax=Shewanella sp. SP1S1-7 TaxID=3063536 RepID=UPI00288D31EA|nr:IS91 family transposase [Shewanella sp. SP1S1-7]MDT3337472.1 IS91 family transposase [Shewanella sp. SP1S1-7]
MATSYHVSDILHQHLAHYQQQHKLTEQQALVCQHIQLCRTQALGLQQWRCDTCQYVQQVFCSCGDRHCPRCQGRQTQAWIAAQQAQVLPCRYFHLVFTLPHELNILAHYAAKPLYSALFESVWQTLAQFGMKRKHLQGQLGCTMVLHTWGQTLSQHIHLHCLIPGGVVTSEGDWHGVKTDYLFPVRALSTVYRAKLLRALRQHELAIPAAETLMAKPWCVYSKACLSRAETVVEYLGRYTRKGMLHESRIAEVTAEHVSFHYKDYRDGQQHKQMRLSCDEFIRRYLLHVLPKGLMRVRHFGFLANACRRKKLALIQRQLRKPQVVLASPLIKEECWWSCPQCQLGHLQFIGEIRLQRLVMINNQSQPVRLSG